MTDPEQDEVFEAYLKRRPVLPALADEIEPPAALDQSVLNQAREAIQSPGATVGGGSSRDSTGVGGTGGVGAGGVGAGGAGAGGAGNGVPPGAAKQRPPRWAVPVALAATILLCLSVVMNISLNTNRPSPNLARMTAARADVKTSALANATAESDAAAGVNASSAARDAVAANNGERRESVSGDIASHEVVLPRAKVAGTPAPHAPVVAEPAAPASASGSLTASARSEAKAPTAPLADALEQKSERTTAGAASHAPAAMASANGAAPVSPAEAGGSADVSSRIDAAPGGSVSGGIGAAPRGSGNVSSGARAVPGASGNVSGGAVPGAPSAADKAVLMAKETGVAAPQYTPAPEPERAAASARKAAKAAMVAPHPADPKVWLQQIAALRAAGKSDQADAEMQRFKAAFPDYRAPPAQPDLPK